jgi:O6-methylguanine-DNA--protein-cysteine methyltransferase
VRSVDEEGVSAPLSTLTAMTAAMVLRTPIGTVGLEATDVGVRRVHLPGSSHPEVRGDANEHAAAAAAQQVAEYLRGEREAFELGLDWEGVDDKHRGVLEALCEVAPFGTTVTYGELGRRAGIGDARRRGDDGA